MRPLRERLREGAPLVADGAMGTMLFTRGLDAGASPEAFGFEHPGVVASITRAYVEAGAAIVHTNTFGASPLRLAAHGLEDRCVEINRRAVETARRAAREARGPEGGGVWVSGSCGPCGKLLQPYGDASPDEVLDGFRRQMRALAAAGVDGFTVETMTAIEEACLAVRAAKDVAPSLPVMATMTFDRTPRGFFTVMGVSVEAAARELEAAGADAAGSNCGQGGLAMLEVARAFRAATRLPLLIQPNAGLPETREGRLVYNESPADMARVARELVSIGVTITGGCCGTTPAHVRAMREAVAGP